MLWLAVVCAPGANAQAIAQQAEAMKAPNIVLVVIDDASPTDIGAYGSEINTPNIDRLAARGARFTNFRASPMCAPSRAMLLTGLDSHLAGIANLPESVPPSHEGRPGYLGRLADGVVTIATLLQRGGYRTYAAGKWHLGHTPGALPGAHGFDHSFVVDATGADNWEQRPYLPIYEDADWFEDDQPVRLPDDFYSSKHLVDRMIGYIGDAAGDKPFFAYLPFLAIHIPVQAPLEFTDRYQHTYAGGWEVQRQRRHSAAVQAGLIPADAAVRTQPPSLRDWNVLNATEQAAQARAQAVNAGMMEAMDFHLGRLIDHLEQIGELDNTLFMVLADNGAEPSDPTTASLFRAWLASVGYATDLPTLGTRGSFAAIGPEAAQANAMPFALFKFHAAEGGVRVPLIIAGPGVVAGQRVDAFSYITDLAPTLLNLSGAAAPDPAMTGKDLTALLSGAAAGVYGTDEAVGMEAAGAAALYKGALKLVRDLQPYGDGQWHLYDLAADPGETNDLALARPEVLLTMIADYQAYAARVGVLEVPDGYNPVAQTGSKAVRVLLNRHKALLISLVLVLIALIGGAWWAIVRRLRAHR